MIHGVRLGGNRMLMNGRLLRAGVEDGFAVVGGVHARGREPIAYVGDPVVRQHHGGPAAMPVRRHTAFPHRLGFFEDRRLPVILEEDDIVAGLFFDRFAGAGQNIGFRLADDFLLIGVFADDRRGCATGNGHQSQQA